MQCEDFRLQIDSAPDEAFDGKDEHLGSCQACTDYLEKASAFEALLGQALRVDVPELAMPDLDAATDNVVSLHPKRESTNKLPTYLALAASITLAVFVGFKFLNTGDADTRDLADQILVHMAHEEYSRVVTATPVSHQTLQEVTGPAAAEVDEDLGLISYAMSCEINGNLIPHLVVQGKNGPVTILILPNEDVRKAFELQSADFHGTILPVGKRGSVAIIGRKGEAIDDIREKIGENLRLSI